MLGVEASGFEYTIMTPVNVNYDTSVVERDEGYGLYGITLNSIPDASVGYWMPNKEFLVWAAITVEEFERLKRYDLSDDYIGERIYATVLDKFKQEHNGLYNSDEFREMFFVQLNTKLAGYSFEDMIKAGILMKGFGTNADTGVVETVKLEFVVDLGEFAFSGSGIYPFRLPVNIVAEFDVLTSGSRLMSSIYAVQVYQKQEFEITGYSGTGTINIESQIISNYFEREGDTIHYYGKESGDIIRFARIKSFREYVEFVNRENKVEMLESMLKYGDALIIPLTDTNIYKPDGSYGIVSGYRYVVAFYYKAGVPEDKAYIVAVAV